MQLAEGYEFGAGVFDEIAYLAMNPDVAAAVRNGAVASGRAHYEAYGKREGRKFSGLGTRESRVLRAIDSRLPGVEIGPSHNPIAPKRLGYKTHVVDHLDQAALRAKYTGHAVNLDNIEEVDFVWHGEPLTELIGATARYGWVIASHVLEHIPNPVLFLQQCEGLLELGGVLSLAIPDKRYCFDCLSPTTSTGELLDAWHEKRTRPSPGQVFNHHARATSRGGSISWNDQETRPLQLIHSLADAKAAWASVANSTDYFDVHCWRFTPESFGLLINDLWQLGLTTFQPKLTFETIGNEFCVTLSVSSQAPAMDRLEVMKQLAGQRTGLESTDWQGERARTRWKRRLRRVAKEVLGWPRS